MTDPLVLDRFRRHAPTEPRLDDDAPWERSDTELEPDEPHSSKLDLLRARAPEIIERLDADDKYLLEAHVLRGAQQRDVGRALGMQQSSISYRVQRLRLRLRVLAALPVIPPAELRAYLAVALTAGEAATCLAMLEVPCHRQLAPRLGICTGAVRARCHRALIKLHAAAKGHDETTINSRVYRLFKLTFMNATVLHRQRTAPSPSATFNNGLESHESKLE